MKIDKQDFLYFLRKGFIKYNYGLSQKQLDFTIKKAEQLIDLFNELDDLGLLKKLLPQDIEMINNKFDVSSLNIGEIGKMTTSFIDMVKNNKNKQGKEFILVDESGNQYNRSAHQIAIFIGLSYASLCEFNRIWLSQFIDFDKMGEKTPHGIGSLIYLLKKKNIKSEFFDHMDPEIRNSFFHLDFKFDGMKVYCKNSINKDYIELQDLLKYAINADRSGLVVMYACYYYVNKVMNQSKFSN